MLEVISKFNAISDTEPPPQKKRFEALYLLSLIFLNHKSMSFLSTF